jgi:uncharacterized protein (DUF2141 family)
MADVRMHALGLLATLTSAVMAPALASAASAPLPFQVMVPNLKPGDRVVVRVYNDAGAWVAEGKPYLAAQARIEEGTGVVGFRAPAGRYAVVAFRDANGDGRLNRLPFGWPTEKVGYSGGERPLFGAPDWDKADFGLVDGERTTVFVRLK